MDTKKPQSPRVKLDLKQKMDLLGPYVSKKILEQVKAVALIVVYLVLFQWLILGIPVAEALVVGVGIAVIVLGLAFFMEGLFLGLMPLGETIGVRLPQKAKLPVILIFALILGVGVTFAEPAIGVLQMAGSFIKVWDAPLLFLMLNKYAGALKWAVGIGVGLAVMAGMLRFMFQWSLKPFLYIGIPAALFFSIWAQSVPNMSFLIGLAWDCGGVTTGPVTVPLVLALGIGVCRVINTNSTESGGFGVVTLASLFPIITVLGLGVLLLPSVPQPMDQKAFFSSDNQAKVEQVFESREAMIGYALANASPQAQETLLGGEKEMAAYLASLAADPELQAKVFGPGKPQALRDWALSRGSEAQRLAVFGTAQAMEAAIQAKAGEKPAPLLNVGDVVSRNSLAAVQAILPLVLFMLLVLLVLLREKLAHTDEIILGVFFALLGMCLFNVGIELGLSKLGSQVGNGLPSSFMEIPLPDQAQTLSGFDTSLVQTALKPDGTREQFFYAKLGQTVSQIPFDPAAFDPATGQYHYVPIRGPLFGGGSGLAGIVVVLLFAFVMGYGATLAEPALNALGITVETLTAGAFKKSLLMQAVAVGVGLGILVGVMKIIWGIPLIWLLAPPYALLLILSWFSTEEFVNIGWDSAGVTTGPITVPLVLAMGLGLSSRIGAIEGFGILATASAFPILSVLATGLVINLRKKAALKAAEA